MPKALSPLNLATFTNLRSLSCQDIDYTFQISTLSSLNSLSIQTSRSWSPLKFSDLVSLRSFSIQDFGSSLELTNLPNLCSISISVIRKELELCNLPSLISLSLGKLYGSQKLSNLPNLTSLSYVRISGRSTKIEFNNINSLKSFHCDAIDESSSLEFVKSPIVSFSCNSIYWSNIKFVECPNLETIHFENASISNIDLESLPTLKKLGLINIKNNFSFQPLVLKLKKLPEITCLNSIFPENVAIEIEDCNFTTLKFEKINSKDTG